MVCVRIFIAADECLIRVGRIWKNNKADSFSGGLDFCYLKQTNDINFRGEKNIQ